MSALTLKDTSNCSQRFAVDRVSRRRVARRCLAILPVIIRVGGREHVGVLRDISRAGMFFYSGITPVVGSEIEVVIRASEFDSRVTACCRCKVIRTEVHRAGAATGVGVAIASYEPPVYEALESGAKASEAYRTC